MGDSSGVAKVYHPEGKELMVMKGHSDTILNIDVHPSGKILTAGSDGNAVLWDKFG